MPGANYYKKQKPFRRVIDQNQIDVDIALANSQQSNTLSPIESNKLDLGQRILRQGARAVPKESTVGDVLALQLDRNKYSPPKPTYQGNSTYTGQYLSKPFTPEPLGETLSQSLNASRPKQVPFTPKPLGEALSESLNRGVPVLPEQQIKPTAASSQSSGRRQRRSGGASGGYGNTGSAPSVTASAQKNTSSPERTGGSNRRSRRGGTNGGGGYSHSNKGTKPVDNTAPPAEAAGQHVENMDIVKNQVKASDVAGTVAKEEKAAEGMMAWASKLHPGVKWGASIIGGALALGMLTGGSRRRDY